MGDMLYWRWRDCVSMWAIPNGLEIPAPVWPLERWFYQLLGAIYLQDLARDRRKSSRPPQKVLAHSHNEWHSGFMNDADTIIALARLAETRPEIAFVLRHCGLDVAAKLYLSEVL